MAVTSGRDWSSCRGRERPRACPLPGRRARASTGSLDASGHDKQAPAGRMPMKSRRPWILDTRGSGSAAACPMSGPRAREMRRWPQSSRRSCSRNDDKGRPLCTVGSGRGCRRIVRPVLGSCAASPGLGGRRWLESCGRSSRCRGRAAMPGGAAPLEEVRMM